MNPYAEGTLEWHAWGHGFDYGTIFGNGDSSPLSGEYANSPVPHEVVRRAWQAAMGGTWDTYRDGTDEDRNDDDAIVDAWEEGYFSL